MSKKSFKGTGADLFFSDTPLPIQDTFTVKNLKVNPLFKSLIPPLSREEYSQLEENLLQNGIREAISVWNETIVDGHNRHEIAQKHNLPYTTVSYEFKTENDVILWIIKNQFGRRNLSAYDRSILAIRLKPVIAKQAKENQKEAGGAVRQNSAKAIQRKLIKAVRQNSAKAIQRKFIKAVRQNSAKAPINTRDELAKLAGVSHDTISKVEKIEELATPEIRERLKRGDISIHKAYQDIKRQGNCHETTAFQSKLLLSINGVFDVIYADCPWESIFSDSENGVITNRHLLTQLKSLDIPSDDNAILFMWATAPILDKALQVVTAWGFTYHTCAIWDKTKVIMGQWFRGQYEMLLIGTKGKFKPPEDIRVSSIYREKIKKQSLKPTYYYDLIENMFPDGRYLGLFAIDKHSDKWTVWNNQNIRRGDER